MTEGRPLHGDDFVENMQDYFKERVTYGTDSDEYAEMNRVLEQELADLQALHEERSRPDARSNIEDLIREKQARIDQLRASDEQPEARAGIQSNPQAMNPTDEAQSQVDRDLKQRMGQGNIKEV